MKHEILSAIWRFDVATSAQQSYAIIIIQSKEVEPFWFFILLLLVTENIP